MVSRAMLLPLLVVVGMVGGGSSTSQGQCQEITIPMCKDIGYNFTSLPNQFNHESQEEAGLEVHQFWPLVKIECSVDLRFFLCSMYTPICMENYQHPVPACRSVCERARLGCLAVMAKHGFPWPARMNCERFPEYGTTELCMDERAQQARVATQGKARGRPSTIKKETTCQCQGCGSRNVGWSGGPPVVALRPGDLQYNWSRWGGEEHCAAPCHSVFFPSQWERQFTELWLAIWATACAVSTALTFSTFLLDTHRFHYPERPIMFLSLCYLLVSLGYLLRVSLGHEAVSCSLQRPGEPPSHYNQLVARARVPGGRDGEASLTCTAVFVTIYFFYMASSVWWVLLTFTWFLSAGLKWAQESISQQSVWYHTAAWTLPMLQTFVILLTQGVEGDPVSGVCWVGVSNSLTYVVLPLSLYLILGLTFLSAGFISLFRIRTVIKEQGGRAKIDKLEKLMFKIGIFSILYIVPSGTVIACSVYEAVWSQHWERSYMCPNCVSSGELSAPDFSVMMLKYLMTLAVGITSGFWVCSGKTVDAWSSSLARLCGISIFVKPPGGPVPAPGPRQGAPLPQLPLPPPTASPPPHPGNLYSTIPHKTSQPLNHV